MQINPVMDLVILVALWEEKGSFKHCIHLEIRIMMKYRGYKRLYEYVKHPETQVSDRKFDACSSRVIERHPSGLGEHADRLTRQTGS